MTPKQNNLQAIQATIAGLAILVDDLFKGGKGQTMFDLCQFDPADEYSAALLRMVKDLHALSPMLQHYAIWRKARA